MSPGMSLTIPYEPASGPKRTSLGSDVQQMVRQKGPFHTITEDRLLEEFNAPQDEDVDSEQEDETSVEGHQATLERLFKVKMEMLQQIGQVQQELLTLIDGMSLVVAANSRLGRSAMSPALRDAVPVGSGATRKIERKRVPKEVVSKLMDVSTIYRAQALESASQSLSKAADRLETEAQRQAKYWQQLASLRARGWPISRLPNNNRVLVVHFGTAESGPTYLNRGIVMLHQDAEGNLVLPGQLEARTQKVLSVTIYRKNIVTEKDLLHARESLFQDELFTEAAKEARLIANMDVKSRSSSIDLQLSADCSVNISYTTRPEDLQHDSQADRDLACLVAYGLRLMLVTEHEHRHIQRSQQKPPPLAPGSRPAPEYALLRPIFAQLRHHDRLSGLLATVRAYQVSLKVAGLNLSFDIETQNAIEGYQLNLHALRRMVATELKVSLPSGKFLTIKIETHLAPPLFGTQYSSTTYESICGPRSCAQTSSMGDMTGFLEDVLAKDVVSMLLDEQRAGSWQVYRDCPLVLSIAGRQQTTTTIFVTCGQGRLALSRLQRGSTSKERVQWDQHGAHFIGEDRKGEDVEPTLIDIAASWASRS
ncbi:RNA polymerase II mediator complex subunit [Lithohypha guttulata]|nr:RNA polymerase II mediator complex subunit [Lithohypha guttulata]